MTRPLSVPSFLARVGLPRLLGLATLAGTAAIWGLANGLLSVPGNRFSPVFSTLLRLDLVYLPFFVAVVILAMALAARAGRPVSPIERFGSHPWWMALAALILTAILAVPIYQEHPLAMDEYAVYFQSQIFAAGHLTGHFPPSWVPRLIPPWFQNSFLLASTTTGDVASAYWPGFALLMAPFSHWNLAWLCNPVLTAFSVAVLMLTARRLVPHISGAAGWAAAFAIASPVVLALGVSYYAMTALMLANMLYLWGFLDPRPATLFWSGVAGSIALTLHNPLPHLLFALPWIFWLIRQRGWGRDLLSLLAGYLPLALLLGVGWLVLRGQIGGTPVHSGGPVEAILGLANQVFVLPDGSVFFMRAAGFAKLWLWAMPGLLVLAALGWWKGRRDPYVSLLAQSALLTFVGYLFVPFDQGHGWGYRYFHSAWFVLPLLAAYYVADAGTDVKRQTQIKSFACALVVCSFVLVVPIYLFGVREFIGQLVNQAPPASATEPLRLTFIYPRQGFYAADLVQNDPFLRGSDIRMLGSDPESDARFVHGLAPDATEAARASAGIMWHLPRQPEER